MKYLIIIFVFTLIWSVWSFFSSNVDEPKYVVLEKNSKYEIREYSSFIEAQVILSGDYREAMNDGFRILAGYIFGDNISSEKIAMTAPVLDVDVNEKIAMTAPVLEQYDNRDKSRIVSFVMPDKYTLDNLPRPKDDRIRLVEIPSHKSAVMRFGWFVNESKIEKKKTELISILQKDGIETVGNPRVARYNPPWTIPFMVRNEIIINIK